MVKHMTEMKTLHMAVHISNTNVFETQNELKKKDGTECKKASGGKEDSIFSNQMRNL